MTFIDWDVAFHKENTINIRNKYSIRLALTDSMDLQETTYAKNNIDTYTKFTKYVFHIQLGTLIPRRFAFYIVIWGYFAHLKIPFKVALRPLASGSN